MKRAVALSFFSLFGVALALAQTPGAAPPTKSESGGEQQVKELEQQLRSQVIKGDTSGIERFEADDCVNIDGSGMMSDKNHSIEMLKNGTVKYTAIDVKEERVRMYGNTAIYNGLANTKMTANGQDHSGDYRVTIVWAKLDGQWKRLSFQATPVISQESETHRAELSSPKGIVSGRVDVAVTLFGAPRETR
jgi:ketosteroid isomerase-like protein